MILFLYPLAYNFLQSCSASIPATLVGKTVETLLAPVDHMEKFEVKDDDESMRCQKGKGKATVSEDDETVEPPSKLQKRLRGRRRRGRRSPVPDDV